MLYAVGALSLCQTTRTKSRLKMVQKPHIVWSLGPEALKCESIEPYPKGPKDPIIRYLGLG